MGRAKTIFKVCWPWVWRPIAFANLVIGIAGVPGDLGTWSTWIDLVMNDPLVLQLAGHAVAIAEVINNPLVRVGLVISGLLMLIWPLRWFWRLRHRLMFLGRRALSDKVWVSRGNAVKLITGSRWAISRRARAQKPTSVTEWLRNAGVADPEEREKSRLFATWCELALEKFEHEEVDVVRQASTEKEYDEAKLRAWLSDRYTGDVIDEFGAP